MLKNKIFLIFGFLAFILIGCSQDTDGIFIEGNISEINEKSGVIEVDGLMIINEIVSSTESFQIENESSSHTIQVSNPEDYKVGQEVKVNVIKDYEEDIWNLDR
ncbi:hypothetical protein GGQ92_001179 [Gracilibacillus halotolerans]|uniref:S1 motif domain-containing protein n=1 Tax=Gracilibacillus halotolerans TaxID=74386 RepID=A0A841RLQ9_9BACI|nr:hypothetical protein [Gracilibacillus halotolerans]MBB6512396.1 hypothetical protein [Gracilibacillus halotolerans]